MRFNNSRIPAVSAGLALLAGTVAAPTLALVSISPAPLTTTASTKTAINPNVVTKNKANQEAFKVWKKKVEPYVRVSDFVATINPSIREHLSAQDVIKVQQAVAKYNALPLASRKTPLKVTSSVTRVQANSLCSPYASTTYYWWGSETYMNHCTVVNLEAGYTAAAIFGSFINPIIAAAIGLCLANIMWADGQCPNGGAILVLSAVGPGFAKPAC